MRDDLRTHNGAVPSTARGLAILTYDDMRASENPSRAVLAFVESLYEGAAKKAGWPMEDLRHKHL